ncbi:MAG: aminotransferase class IV [Armatimonadota bacterium]|jgi:branched-chain amino acid aminotransferase
MAGIAWVNGKLFAPDEPAIAPADRGFMYGEGLFETMRAYRGKVFRQARHLSRLLASATAIGLAPPSRELLERAITEALAAGGMSNATVRLTVTPGMGGLGSQTVVVLVRQLKLPPPQHYSQGCRVASVAIGLASGSVLRTAKSLNYLDKLLAMRAAEWAGGEEALLVDADGSVIEAAMRNVFAVAGRRLVTPPLSRGLLPGVTREAVLEIVARAGAPAVERDVTVSELQAADECFLTSSVAEVIPVALLDGRAVGGGAPGPVTKQVTEAYRALVAEELGFDSNRSG